MHTDPAFANTLVRFGDCAHTAAELTSGIRDEKERRRRLKNIVRALSRVFWFTVEFGLMRGPHGPLAYGSGLLSSFGELQHAIESDEVQRSPAQIEWMIHQEASDEYQPLLFVVESFDHLFEMVDRLERWMREGRLNYVAPGRAEIKDSDLEGFLHESYR
jgi:phenylalanine-4-hydroxylase